MDVDDGPELPDAGDSPETSWIADERKRLVHRAIGTLNEQNREIILLKEIQGLTFPEISELLGIPVGTVKSRSHRARLELAGRILALDPSYGDPRGRTPGPADALDSMRRQGT